VVKVLLIINIAAYGLQLLLDRPSAGFGWMTSTLAISPATWWQPWRYVTFQFLHGGTMHLLLNMLGLWMIGAPLENHWGGRKFLAFYLSCGAAAGVSYLLLSSIPSVAIGHDMPLVGASGGVYGLLLAAAVLLPQMSLIFLFFPVPIRLAVIILGAIVLLTLAEGFGSRGAGPETFSQMAHFGGLVMGGFWLLVPRWRQGTDGFDDVPIVSDKRKKWREGRWAQKRAKEEETEQVQQAEVDRILEKISQQGLGSITRRERKILNDATARQRDRANQREMRL